MRSLTKSERKRVDALINTLCNRHISFEDGCEELGFDETELSTRQLQAIDENLIQCDVCGKWIKAHEGQVNFVLGRVCRECNKPTPAMLGGKCK